MLPFVEEKLGDLPIMAKVMELPYTQLCRMNHTLHFPSLKTHFNASPMQRKASGEWNWSQHICIAGYSDLVNRLMASPVTFREKAG